MNLIRFYKIQKTIDDLRYSKKRMPKVLEDLMIIPSPFYFKVYIKLNLLEMIEFHNLFDLKINKKIMIEYLDRLKYSDLFVYKLPVDFLQNISNFIDDRMDRLTDSDYKHDLELLMTFY